MKIPMSETIFKIITFLNRCMKTHMYIDMQVTHLHVPRLATKRLIPNAAPIDITRDAKDALHKRAKLHITWEGYIICHILDSAATR